jgi:diguanylate cyclase (GGDEF)-like protein
LVRITVGRRWFINTLVIFGLIVLWLTQAYLFFHVAIELTSLFFATSLYIIGAQTYRLSKNKVLLFISIAFVYVGLFDMLHTLTYNGMSLAPWSTPNLSTQFWIAGRMIQMLTLSFVLVLPRLDMTRTKMEIILASLFLVLNLLIFTGLFPDCYIPGIGLTPFKKTVEYVIVGMAMGAFVYAGKVEVVHSERIRRSIRLALVFFIASELSFTLYKDAYGVLNALGHFCKVFSYLFVWTMVLDEGFAKPFDHLFRNIYDRSVRDQLTGLYNRRYFDQEVGPRLESENRMFSLVMADVNGLKLINDAFGHEEGDRLLRLFTEALRRQCREKDMLMRIGGDEFLLLLQDTSRQEAESLIERIKLDFGNQSIKGIPCSASFGCTERWSAGDTKEILFNRAESEMYRRKIEESPVMKRKIIGGVLRHIREVDPAEQAHSDAVATYSGQIARQLGLPREKVRQIRDAALLHDIGKIRFINGSSFHGAEIEEWQLQELRRHPEVGYNLLVTMSDYAQLAPYVLHHHERWDGTGYPLSLSGEDIPLEARIIAIAEAYDAMIEGRSWKGARGTLAAIEEIRRCAGTQFDPVVVKAFINILSPGEYDSSASE